MTDLVLYAHYADEEVYSLHTCAVKQVHAENHLGLYFAILFNIHSKGKAKLIYKFDFLLHHRVSDEGEKVTCLSKDFVQTESVRMQSFLRKNKIV